MNNFLKTILGEVLHIANSQPPFLYKAEFYRMKDKILFRYGDLAGFDVQHIVKECWGYYGERFQEYPINNLGMVVSVKRKCARYGGSGVYLQFWTYLLCYKMGKRSFHLPAQKYYTDPQLNLQRPMIKGYVQHQKYPYYLSTEAFFWLCLFFDFNLFLKTFALWGMSARKYTPMVILADFLWRIRRRFNLLRDFMAGTAGRLAFRLRHLRNEFPIGNSDDEFPF